MNYFWKKKKKKKLLVPEDEQQLKELYNILKVHGDAILSGATTLTLTAPILILLNRSFQAITEGVKEACFQVATSNHELEHTELHSFELLIFDFIQKVVSLKVVPGTIPLDVPVLDVSYFKSLKYLELRKVPIQCIGNLHLIRRELKSLTCCRATSSVKNVVNQFGKDPSERYILPCLKYLNLSCNTINNLEDDSLVLLPALEHFDVSYNCIKDIYSKFLPPISHLCLGYNKISQVPDFPANVAKSLTTLILRNNNLTSLQGIRVLRNLTLLDLTSNCVGNFAELTPIAFLEKLTNVSLEGNPISYCDDYRLLVIQKLSPVKRNEKIKLDGVELNDYELSHLGHGVEPVSLAAYIPNCPNELTNNSINWMARGLPNLPQSYPNDQEDSSVSQRRKSKIRQKLCIPEISGSPSSDILSSSVSSEVNSHNNSAKYPIAASVSVDVGRLDGGSSNILYRARKNSAGNSIMWQNNISGSVRKHNEVRSLTKLDYDSWSSGKKSEASDLETNDYSRENEPSCSGTFSDFGDSDDPDMYEETTMSVENVINELNKADGSNQDIHHVNSDKDLSVLSNNGDLDITYVVKNEIGANETFSGEETEYLFLYLNPPYLLEKDYDGKLRNKLDLNYLVNIESFRDAELIAILRFDLLRIDWRYRKYIFEQVEHIDMFISILQPLVVQNHQKQMLKLKYCECLKCGHVFVKSAERAVCESCGSNMVIDKYNMEKTNLSSSRSNDLNKDDITASIIRRSSSHENSSSWPPSVKQNNIDSAVNTCHSFVSNLHVELNGYQEEQKNTSDDGKSNSELEKEESNFASILWKMNVKKNSPFSSPEHSCNNSYSSESSTPNPHQSFSGMTTPILSLKGTTLVEYGEFLKCNHRLKLYLTLNMYRGCEEYLCQIRCGCAMYNTSQVFDAVLNVSNLSVYVLAILDPKSDIPEENLKKVAFSPLSLLKRISYGYLNQSFTMEFSKPKCHFKFLVGDSDRVQSFINILKDKLVDAKLSAVNMIFLEDDHQQTISDIKKQVFGMKEDFLSMSKRIYSEMLKYRSHPLFQTKKLRMRTFYQCFTGNEFVDWLFSRREADSRIKVVKIGQQLLDGGMIYNVQKNQEFSDSDSWYKFTPAVTVDKLEETGNPCSGEEGSWLEEKELDFDIKIHMLCYLRKSEIDAKFHYITLISTNTHIFLTRECHQWPLPQYHPPSLMLKQHYRVKNTARITSLISVDFYEDASCYATLYFADEMDAGNANGEKSWLLRTETPTELKKFYVFLKETWEKLFEIELKSETQPTIELVL